jgi:hypothetical protein
MAGICPASQIKNERKLLKNKVSGTWLNELIIRQTELSEWKVIKIEM